jgi:hypothetical protein
VASEENRVSSPFVAVGMTAISRVTASETDLSAFRRSESAGTPKLYGLDLPDEVRQKIYYGNALRVPPGAATDRLVTAADFTDAADHHLVLWTVRQASRRRPSAAVMAGRAVLNRGWR